MTGQTNSGLRQRHIAGKPRAQYEKDAPSEAIGSANSSGEMMLQVMPKMRMWNPRKADKEGATMKQARAIDVMPSWSVAVSCSQNVILGSHVEGKLTTNDPTR